MARFQILDHGYIELVETWGSDERVIESARMSTGRSFYSWHPYWLCRRCDLMWVKDSADTAPPQPHEQPWRGGGQCGESGEGHDWRDVPKGDAGLLRFLWEKEHATPFEMAGATFEVQAPIFVFREWHRHRVPFGYNEASARYAPLPDLNYVPQVSRLLLDGGKNKQAGAVDGAAELNADTAREWRAKLEEIYRDVEEFYQWGLQLGVPKELARVALPVGRYSKMRATGNLRGWLAFLKLRTAPGAQAEIREYARVTQVMLSEVFPRTLELFGGSQ